MRKGSFWHGFGRCWGISVWGATTASLQILSLSVSLMPACLSLFCFSLSLPPFCMNSVVWVITGCSWSDLIALSPPPSTCTSRRGLLLTFHSYKNTGDLFITAKVGSSLKTAKIHTPEFFSVILTDGGTTLPALAIVSCAVLLLSEYGHNVVIENPSQQPQQQSFFNYRKGKKNFCHFLHGASENFCDRKALICCR